MKIRSILWLLPLAWLLQGCYEDHSNTSIENVNPIVIDLGGASTALTAYSLDSIIVQPVVYKVGTPDAGLSFKWDLSTADLPNVTQKISDKMELRTIVPVEANTVPYVLTLTVTEEATGLQNFMQFALTVGSDLGKGLVVADSDDGATSDLNLIMAKEFSQVAASYNARNTRVVRDVYSTINGAPLPGVVKGMVSTFDARSSTNPRALTVITDRHAYRMDPYVYRLQFTDGEMFMVPSVFDGMEIEPTYIGGQDGPIYDHMVISGKVYLCNLQWGEYLYKLNTETSDGSSYYITQATSQLAGRTYSCLAAYDDLNNRFLAISGVGDNAIMPLKNPTRQGPFDLNDLGEDLTALYMGSGVPIMLDPTYGDQTNTVSAVMQSKTGNKRYLMTFCAGNPYVNEYYAINKYDMTSVTGFANSIAWECSPIENVFYYANPDKAYSMVMSGETPTPTEVFTPEAGEKITGMMLWRFTDQGRIYIKNPPGSSEERSLINSGNRMMVISTYNESTGEGKITCVPVMYVGSGTLETDRNFHVVFDGFGRIVSLAHQPA